MYLFPYLNITTFISTVVYFCIYSYILTHIFLSHLFVIFTFLFSFTILDCF